MNILKEILLIEDDETTLFLTQEIIRGMGIVEKVTVKRNGSEAINYLLHKIINGNQFPKVIFVDAKMPIMDGFGFLGEYNKLKPLLGRHPSLIFMVSCVLVDLIRDKAKELGIDYCLTKPLICDNINSALEKLSISNVEYSNI
ncbi:MAG: response regulator [Flavobacteriales bacterium]|nr:response regulator [Flavobacteriales bacterium]